MMATMASLNIQDLLVAAELLDHDQLARKHATLCHKRPLLLEPHSPDGITECPEAKRRKSNASVESSTSSGTEGGDGGANTPSTGSQTRPKRDSVNRTIHNALEKTRRAQLRSSLDRLNGLLPNTNEPSRITTLNLLTRATNYVESLRDQQQQQEEEKARLVRQQQLLRRHLSLLKQHASGAGSPVQIDVLTADDKPVVAPTALPPPRPDSTDTISVVGEEADLDSLRCDLPAEDASEGSSSSQQYGSSPPPVLSLVPSTSWMSPLPPAAATQNHTMNHLNLEALVQAGLLPAAPRMAVRFEASEPSALAHQSTSATSPILRPQPVRVLPLHCGAF